MAKKSVRRKNKKTVMQGPISLEAAKTLQRKYRNLEQRYDELYKEYRLTQGELNRYASHMQNIREAVSNAITQMTFVLNSPIRGRMPDA